MDSNSIVPKGRVGSTPTRGTNTEQSGFFKTNDNGPRAEHVVMETKSHALRPASRLRYRSGDNLAEISLTIFLFARTPEFFQKGKGNFYSVPPSKFSGDVASIHKQSFQFAIYRTLSSYSLNNLLQ